MGRQRDSWHGALTLRSRTFGPAEEDGEWEPPRQREEMKRGPCCTETRGAELWVRSAGGQGREGHRGDRSGRPGEQDTSLCPECTGTPKDGKHT